MRKSILFLVPALAACDGGSSDDLVLIPDFVASAPSLECEAVELPVEVAPTEVRQATDSTWIVLDDPQRSVWEFDDRLRLRGRIEFPVSGPGSAPRPVSASLLGDTAVAVAARGGLRLVVASREGRELNRIDLDFIPHSIEALADGSLLVAPMPFGSRPPTLLRRAAPIGWVDVPIPHREYPDMTVRALGNSTLIESMADGTVYSFHQFFRPLAYRVSPAGEVERLMPPSPDDAAAELAYVPSPPLDEAEVERSGMPAIALAVDQARSELYLLTRTGRPGADGKERALLRLDGELGLIAGYRVPVRAAGMAALPRQRGVILVDTHDAFHLCRLPPDDVEERRADGGGP